MFCSGLGFVQSLGFVHYFRDFVVVEFDYYSHQCFGYSVKSSAGFFRCHLVAVTGSFFSDPIAHYGLR